MSDRLPDAVVDHSPPRVDLGELELDLKHALRVVRRDWRIVVLGVALCLTAWLFVIVRTPRTYQATAQLLVLSSGRQPLKVTDAEVSGPVQQDDQFPTYAAILSSPRIVGEAIKEVGLDQLPTLQGAVAGGKSATQAAIAELTVSRPDRAASVLKIDYRARSKAEAVRMVAALVRAFEGFLEESYQSNNTRVVTLITEARDLMSDELDELEEQYLEVRKQNAALAADEAGRSFVTRRLDRWNMAINEAMVRSVELESQLELGRELRDAGVGLTGISYALGQLSGDPTQSLAIGANSNRNSALASDYVRQLTNQQQELADRYGADYSKVQEIEQQIVRVQEVAAGSRRSLEKVDVDDLIRSIEEAQEAVVRLRDQYESRFDTDLDQARQLLNEQAIEESLHDRLERQKALFNTVVDQLKQAQLVGEYSGVVTQTIEPPQALKGAVAPRVMLTLMMALLGGGVLGVAAALAADGLDSRLRSLDELRSILSARVLGVIPRLGKAELAGVPEPGLVLISKPESLAAEAYRAVRTALEFTRLQRQHSAQVILVSSPSPADGKSTVSSNLAIGLAQAGRRVLLIDADARKPSVDRIHGTPLGPGLCQALQEGLDWRALVRPSAASGLDLLTAGFEIPNPSELFMSDRFRALVSELRTAYDRIIIDTPPLLYVSDPSIIGPIADGILLVVRLAETRRAEAKRTADIVHMMGTPVLGTVVNGDEAEGAEFLSSARYYGRYKVYGRHERPATAWDSARELWQSIRPGTASGARPTPAEPPRAAASNGAAGPANGDLHHD